MTWFLIVVLTIVVVLALLAVFVLASLISEVRDYEQERIETNIRRAERRLHDIASNSFQAMLDEARSHGSGGTS